MVGEKVGPDGEPHSEPPQLNFSRSVLSSSEAVIRREAGLTKQDTDLWNIVRKTVRPTR